jgi:hypothetical protein
MTIEHYTGGCQCGAVTYEVDADLDNTITCNCSRCQKLGSVLAFAPRASFRLKSGENAVTEYLFNTNRIRHLFCKTCGIESFALGARPDGTPMAAINVNCLDGVEPRSLESKFVDGRSL